MKLVVLFLLTAFLPIICFGLKCYSCGIDSFAGLGRQADPRQQLTPPCEPVEKDCSADGDGPYWCLTTETTTTFTIPGETAPPLKQTYKGCIKKSAEPTITEPRCKEHDKPLPSESPIKLDVSQCFCDKDLCNSNSPAKSTAEIKSISLATCVVTGFLLLA